MLKEEQSNSLVVQWLGLYAFTAEGLGSVPGQGTKDPICHMVWPKQINERGAEKTAGQGLGDLHGHVKKQSWVCSPARGKASLLTVVVKEKGSTHCRTPRRESRRKPFLSPARATMVPGTRTAAESGARWVSNSVLEAGSALFAESAAA